MKRAEKPDVNPRKLKRRRKRRNIFILIVFICSCIGLFLLALSDFFSINTIEVKGNSYYTGAQVVEISGIIEGDNLWKTNMKNARDKLRKDPYIADATVDRKILHRVQITVKERSESFVCEENGGFIVLDYDGVVLRLTDTAPALPIVYGLIVNKAEPGKTIKVDDNLTLTETITFLSAAEKQDIYFKKVNATDLFVQAYIYNNLACKGTYENLTKYLPEIRTVFLDLKKSKIRRGTIIVTSDGSCTFSPEIPK